MARKPWMTAEIFWSRIDKSCGDDACWPWTLAKNEAGRGKVYWMGSLKYAYRVAYELFYGNFNKSLLVCHKCDNPTCCNPKHLFLGTQQDNMNDALRKGRVKILPPMDWKNRTKPHHWQKLSENQVLEIVSRYRAGERQSDLAKEFKINDSAIHKIMHGERWSYLTGIISVPTRIAGEVT